VCVTTSASQSFLLCGTTPHFFFAFAGSLCCRHVVRQAEVSAAWKHANTARLSLPLHMGADCILVAVALCLCPLLRSGLSGVQTRLGATVEDRFLPPKTGLSVHVVEEGMGDAEMALSRLARKGMDSGMMRDWTFRSPLSPNTNRYEKPTQHRQRIARKGLWNFRQNALLTILRTVLFKKVRS
jgi:hypothetical protein